MSRVPYNKLLTSLACSSRTGEYWLSVVFVRPRDAWSVLSRPRANIPQYGPGARLVKGYYSLRGLLHPNVVYVNIVCVAFLVSEEYSIAHYKLKDCQDLWQKEATSDRHQWPSIRPRLLLDPPFWLCCKLKISLAQKYPDSREKRLHGKTFRIQSSHLRFRIQNLRRHDQTGMFSFRIHPIVCKRQNQSGTKTFRIPQGGTARKIKWGWAARLKKPLPYI